MPRNLDHRVEVVAPVEDARAQQEIARVFDVLLADNAEAWDLDGTALAPRPAAERENGAVRRRQC